jgi:hypothetical protein
MSNQENHRKLRYGGHAVPSAWEAASCAMQENSEPWPSNGVDVALLGAATGALPHGV